MRRSRSSEGSSSPRRSVARSSTAPTAPLAPKATAPTSLTRSAYALKLHTPPSASLGSRAVSALASKAVPPARLPGT